MQRIRIPESFCSTVPCFLVTNDGEEIPIVLTVDFKSVKGMLFEARPVHPAKISIKTLEASDE